jgi:plasmid stabilization system protein ParE
VKQIVYSSAALDRLADIASYTWDQFGEIQAEAYLRKLSERLEAVANGVGPKPRSCDLLMKGIRDDAGLTYIREGSHYLILRDKPDVLEVVEIFHERMNIDRHLHDLEF